MYLKADPGRSLFKNSDQNGSAFFLPKRVMRIELWVMSGDDYRSGFLESFDGSHQLSAYLIG